jgi:HK97 family phage portal protein
MIVSRLLKPKIMASTSTPMTLTELTDMLNVATSSGQIVTPENSRNVHTADRCINILSDDVAKMPLQTFMSRVAGRIERMRPTSWDQNLAWLLEVRPNRFMTPFVFKKTIIQWLICWGNAYVWQPTRRPGQMRELLVLRSDRVLPVYDTSGNVWYQVTWSPQQVDYLPDVEIMHLRINATDGLVGHSVIEHAREALGRQLGAYETQGKFYSQGLNPAGIIYMSSELNKEARAKVRSAYEEAMSGSSNAYRLAVMDNKVTKFEPITMKPTDMQFLEGITQNDTQIANFFGMPLYKLNMGKQSYNSNEQQNLDYLSTTLDPYLVQFEQEAGLKWLSEEELNYTYLRFNRDVLLRTDAKTRAEVIEKRILSGVLTPNEGRQIDDLNPYEGGDGYYIPANMMQVNGDGNPMQEEA